MQKTARKNKFLSFSLFYASLRFLVKPSCVYFSCTHPLVEYDFVLCECAGFQLVSVFIASNVYVIFVSFRLFLCEKRLFSYQSKHRPMSGASKLSVISQPTVFHNSSVC